MTCKCASPRREGDQSDPADTAVIDVLPAPRVVAGEPDPVTEQAVFRGINANTTVLLAHSAGEIDSVDMATRPQRLPDEA